MLLQRKSQLSEDQLKDEIRSMARTLDLRINKQMEVRHGDRLVHSAVSVSALHSYLTQAIHAKRDSYQFKTKPYDHQQLAFDISKDREYFALLMEQGT